MSGSRMSPIPSLSAVASTLLASLGSGRLLLGRTRRLRGAVREGAGAGVGLAAARRCVLGASYASPALAPVAAVERPSRFEGPQIDIIFRPL